MDSTATVNPSNLGYVNGHNEPSIGVRALQNVLLSELPGVTFAVLTLVYVVASLVTL